MQSSVTQSTRTQRTVVLRGCGRRIHEPRVQRNDDEALVLELESKLRRRDEGCGLCHAVCAEISHTEGEDGLAIASTRTEDHDLLRVRRSEERKECGDAVDRAKTVDLEL